MRRELGNRLFKMSCKTQYDTFEKENQVNESIGGNFKFKLAKFKVEEVERSSKANIAEVKPQEVTVPSLESKRQKELPTCSRAYVMHFNYCITVNKYWFYIRP